MIKQKANIQVSTVLQRELSINRLRSIKPLSSKIGKYKELFKYLGPAFIVSVAYIDPGNTSPGTSMKIVIYGALLRCAADSKCSRTFICTLRSFHLARLVLLASDDFQKGLIKL